MNKSATTPAVEQDAEQYRAEMAQERATRGYAQLVASAMGLSGAGALSGDVIGALDRLGLALVPRLGYPADHDPATVLAEDTEQSPCPDCGTQRRRLLDDEGKPETGPGAGWWHERGDGWGYRRRCPRPGDED